MDSSGAINSALSFRSSRRDLSRYSIVISHILDRCGFYNRDSRAARVRWDFSARRSRYYNTPSATAATMVSPIAIADCNGSSWQLTDDASSLRPVGSSQPRSPPPSRETRAFSAARRRLIIPWHHLSAGHRVAPPHAGDATTTTII